MRRVSLIAALSVSVSLLAATPPEDDGARWKQRRSRQMTGAAITNGAPGELAVQSTTTFRAGDADGFGFGAGWNPPLSCEVFDNREPEDLGVFDQRRPGGSYNSVCSFSGSWTNGFTVPPGGAGQVVVRMRILGGQTATAYCWAGPCGCETPTEQLFINGVEQTDFLSYFGCAETGWWSKSYSGAEAAEIAAAGAVAFQVNWNNNAFAIDYSEVEVLPIVEVAVLDGDAQKGAISHTLPKPLRVKFTSADPSFDLRRMTAVFEIVSVPANATGHGVGGSETSTNPTAYGVQVGADGIASAVLVLGDKEGPYVVRVKSSLSASGVPATFTSTAKKPASVVILKDTPELSERAATYAVSSTEPTTFHALGLDTDNSSLGPLRCTWSLAGGGSPATRGSGAVAPAGPIAQTSFTPTAVGKVTLKANPTLTGVGTGSADLFITRAYVDVSGAFTTSAPVDEHARYVPGSLLDGSSVLPNVMSAGGQLVKLHVLTGASSRGSVTFTLENVSQYPGIAMNYPVNSTDTAPDVDWGTASMTNVLTVPFSSAGDTVATLRVRDYAAKCRVKVSVTSGRNTYALAAIDLPLDAHNNGIADVGWRALSANVPDPGLDPGADEDNTPVMRPVGGTFLPSDGYGQFGDNLTNFEEYRGFVFFDAHKRTNPFHKDAFVEATAFGDDIQFAYPAMPTSTYRVRISESSGSREVNTNWIGLPGASRPFPHGHQPAIAIHIARGGYNPGILGSEGCARPDIFAPCVPPYAREATVYQGTIDASAAAHGITDPNLIATLRRSVLAHEVGHSHNLLHNDTPACLMFGGSFTEHQGWGAIPTSFCVGVDTTITDCTFCGPTFSMPATNFNETDTLRFKARP